MIYTGTIANGLKATLNKVITDKTDGVESRCDYHKYVNVIGMSDAWEDDLEVGGPGLASEKAEGVAINAGDVKEGYVTRYIARTFAQKLVATEEALEDNKYPKIIDAVKRLKRAMYKTLDVDVANILVRMFDATYVGGDGLPLGSATHTLPLGGTFSNVMATPLAPSRAALITVTTQAMNLVGHDGIEEGYKIKKIVCPNAQWAVWEGILKSAKAPEPGSFNEINVFYNMGISSHPITHWTNTTTNWAALTDCDAQLNLRFRRKPRGNTWFENDNTVMMYSNTARWARGWSDPRAAICVEA